MDSGELGGDAGQEAVGGRARGQWRPKVSVTCPLLVSMIWRQRPCWRRARLARRPLGGVSPGAPSSWSPWACPSVPSKPVSAREGSSAGGPRAGLRPARPGRAHIRRALGARGAARPPKSASARQRSSVLAGASTQPVTPPVGSTARSTLPPSSPSLSRPPQPQAALSPTRRRRQPRQRCPTGTATVSRTS